MNKGTAFKKPYAKEIFGVELSAHYAYPREILVCEDIFPFLVFDGGAFNLLNDRFGTAKGSDLLELVMSDKLFDEFRHCDDKFNWEASFAYTNGTSFTPKYEWQIWPQRLYMTIPLAHAFLKSGDEKYAKKWLQTVKGWDAAHPYQPFDPDVHYLQTDMVWRDMQVAWRTMSLLHGIFMLQDAPFSKDEWEYIYNFIQLHANHLYEEAQDRLRRNLAQNHVLQIGIVLIMAGVMFPEFASAEDLIKIGIDTVKMNMDGSIFADGGSDEDSPSYSHFIVRLYLEGYLLLKNNGRDIPDGLEKSINKQYEWIYNMSSPTGKTLQLSDSYVLDSYADIERARKLIDLDLPQERKSLLLPQSGCAVLKRGRISLYCDAMNVMFGHRHYGRPQILLFYGDDPILVDTGVCNYDRWEMYMPLRNLEKHNVVFSPEIDQTKIDLHCGIKSYDGDNGKIVLEAEVTDGKIAYTWEREIILTENKVRIIDRAHSSAQLSWSARYFFKKNDTKEKDSRTLLQLTARHLLTARFDKDYTLSLEPVMNNENRLDYAICATVSSRADRFENEMQIDFEDR